MARRCISSINVEAQQKVREGSSVPPTPRESAPANQTAEQQLLSAHLKEADPAMYEIIQNASDLVHPSGGGDWRWNWPGG